MAKGYNLRQRVRLRTTVKNLIAYGGLGMAAGGVVCAVVLFFGQTFNSQPTKAARVEATISSPQDVCLGDSVRLEANGGDLYRWTPREGLSDACVASPLASPNVTTAYTAAVYRRVGLPLRQSGNMAVTATLLNGRDQTLQRAVSEVNPHQTYLITLRARTAGYLDKATLQIRVNGKTVGTCDVSHRGAAPVEILWQNKNEEKAALSLHLLDYDGDGEAIECDAFDFQAVDRTELTTRVTVNRNCKTCPAPARPQVVNISLKEVKLQWNQLEHPVLVRYRKTGDADWQQVAAKGRAVLLSGLSGSFDYEAEAACVCKNDTSVWTAPLLLRSIDRQLMAGR